MAVNQCRDVLRSGRDCFAQGAAIAVSQPRFLRLKGRSAQRSVFLGKIGLKRNQGKRQKL